jgi:nucleoid-associated protein YgaU
VSLPATVPPKPEKAYLVLLPPTTDGGGAAASAAPSGAGGVPGALAQFNFQFNPTQYTVTKSASWKRTADPASVDAAVPEFLGANPRSLSVDYFVTATEETPDVSPDLDILFSCCAPTEATIGQNRPKPPFVLLAWGNTTSFMAYVKSVTATYRMFSPEGRCIRASGTISLEEIPTQQRRQNPTSGGTASRRTHVVGAGDSLTSIAHREYGDPTLWRPLAEANGIDDPLRVPIGRHLRIPPADDLRAAALGKA